MLSWFSDHEFIFFDSVTNISKSTIAELEESVQRGFKENVIETLFNIKSKCKDSTQAIERIINTELINKETLNNVVDSNSRTDLPIKYLFLSNAVWAIGVTSETVPYILFEGIEEISSRERISNLSCAFSFARYNISRSNYRDYVVLQKYATNRPENGFVIDQIKAIVALGIVGNDSAFEGLANMLLDVSEMYTVMAIEGIRNLVNHKLMVDKLMSVFDDCDIQQKERIGYALSEIAIENRTYSAELNKVFGILKNENISKGVYSNMEDAILIIE